jgi:hypothetical protein
MADQLAVAKAACSAEQTGERRVDAKADQLDNEWAAKWADE